MPIGWKWQQHKCLAGQHSVKLIACHQLLFWLPWHCMVVCPAQLPLLSLCTVWMCYSLMVLDDDAPFVTMLVTRTLSRLQLAKPAEVLQAVAAAGSTECASSPQLNCPRAAAAAAPTSPPCKDRLWLGCGAFRVMKYMSRALFCLSKLPSASSPLVTMAFPIPRVKVKCRSTRACKS